ncbi:MAG: metal-sensitive transcriptional regulator [Candidatus Omnitrophica bacterium]|nr:metal-sensitive transcriptional regulator [Candidatus Omnitrophota bacterium]
MAKDITHQENILALKRIEGQVRGLQKMIEDQRYCVDILTQMRSAIQAMVSVNQKILKKHLEGCVVDALENSTRSEKQSKIDEMVELFSKYRVG